MNQEEPRQFDPAVHNQLRELIDAFGATVVADVFAEVLDDKLAEIERKAAEERRVLRDAAKAIGRSRRRRKAGTSGIT